MSPLRRRIERLEAKHEVRTPYKASVWSYSARWGHEAEDRAEAFASVTFPAGPLITIGYPTPSDRPEGWRPTAWQSQEVACP